ncbi:MAG: outer membrane protein assembly factor BamA [Bacteroidia bacterium]|nr:outer membrane protein assembly factor BamA [Bacteroidia bacterium]
MNKLKSILVFFACLISLILNAQAPEDTTKLVPQFVDYGNPRTYELVNIVITGTNYYDKSVLQVLSGLSIGQKIRVPSEDISKAITNLYKQKLFEDVSLRIMDIQDDKLTLEIYLKEKPRLSTFVIKGLSKSKANTLREEISLKSGQIITDNLVASTVNEIKSFYREKGFLNATAQITQEPDDPKKNTAKLRILVDRGPKIKIHDILIEGNTALTDQKIRKLLKDTKPKRKLFAKSRFDDAKFQDDKQRIIEKYLSLGYRDIEIVSDSVFKNDEKTLNILIRLKEGQKYYFRDIKITGNTKYSTEDLMSILKIKNGDVYDQELLDTRLRSNPSGLDISTLYMDDGYLFFNVNPVEVLVENDSIDLEIRITEGEQARINKVTITGNTKTSDHVVLRELRTKPGQLFSKTDVTRSLRELAQLGYFNPEALNVNPMPNPASGTVDIEYIVEEKPNDQIELSAGWGVNSIVGTLGLTLNNFSTRRMFEKKNWSPVPSGDGQRLSLRAQTNGTFFQSYSASFTEPWLGGRKPNAFSVSVFHSIQSNGFNSLDVRRAGLYTTGVTVGLGRRLKWPDDYFTIQYQVLYQRYYNDVAVTGQSLFQGIPVGITHSISGRIILSRNSTDQPIYPRMGSNISLSIQGSPPYSLITGKDYSSTDIELGSRLLEFYKWKFDASWFTKLIGTTRPLVLMMRTNFGFIGRYNNQVSYTPFERFWVGGAGLIGFALDGRELISLRGYADNSLTPIAQDPATGAFGRQGGLIYNRFTTELRFPISLNPSATVFPLIFAEAGNAWSSYKDFNPFKVYRSFGGGVRIFLPMFGMIGLDYGWGIDEVPFQNGANGGNFHFLLGQQF